jgi:23S rRNA (uracil1939-C5)-methyltransferase
MPQGAVHKTATGGLDSTNACNPACPGCAHKNMSAEESLSQKEGWLKKQLSPWVDRFDPIQTVKPGRRINYRHRICLTCAHDPTGWRFGLVSGKRVIPIHDCPVHTPQGREAVALFSKNLPADADFPLVYYVQAGAQISLVLKTNRMPEMSWLDDALTCRLKRIGIEGVWLHLHPCAGRRVFAKNSWHRIYGKPRSENPSGLEYGPRAFQQLIPCLHEQTLDAAEAFLAPGPRDILIDLYCGIGAGLARWTRRNAVAIGVERDAEAVDCARHNAPDATLLRGGCRERIPQLRAWIQKESGRPGFRLLYANPPRTGLEPEVLEWIAEGYRPDRIVYMSCSAGTLRRDLNRLTGFEYAVTRITPYDFFPQTRHVESLVFLEKNPQQTTRPVAP